jgi:opacity protein-like surface antigen
MKNLIQAAVVTLFAASTAQAQQAVQWRVEDGGNGHWYGAVMEGRDWNAAESNARSIGGHLVTITSMQENAFLVSLGLPWTPSLNLIAYWTGGRRPAAGQPFAWISGEPWDYSNFDASERNGCCGTDVRFVVFRTHPGSEGRWDDTSVNGNMDQYPQRSIVEWSADCNDDGIVDYGQILQGQLADLNADGVPDICQQPTCHDADLYANNRIDGADLGILLSEWGPVTPSTNSDINKDGFVNGADLGIMLSFWGACPN